MQKLNDDAAETSFTRQEGGDQRRVLSTRIRRQTDEIF